MSKQVGDYYANEPGAYREHYIRDAQGNIMATYRYTNTGAASLKLNERPVYGSSRLGSLREEVELHTLPSFDPATANPVQMVDLNYELTDHLGNVCAVVTGRLLDGNGGGTAKQAELVSAQGYEPFGSLLPGRNYSSDGYAYGFNGKLKDDEVHNATGTSYDYGFRMYDPRVGRFLSVDPLSGSYPELTPYQFASNTPIMASDLDGLEARIENHKDESGRVIAITITLDIQVINASTESQEEVMSRAKDIARVTEKVYSRSLIKHGRVIPVTTNVNVQMGDEKSPYKMTFTNVAKPGKPLTLGYATKESTSQEANIFMSTAPVFVEGQPAAVEKLQPGDVLGDGGVTISPTGERIGTTGAHEIGHTFRLGHKLLNAVHNLMKPKTRMVSMTPEDQQELTPRQFKKVVRTIEREYRRSQKQKGE